MRAGKFIVDNADIMNPSPSVESDRPVKIYHERQSKQLCALHALNNLFQNPQAFRKQDLDAICKELAPSSIITNPHRSTFGLGCYDVNVIISALAKKGFETIWFDKRKNPNCLIMDEIYGFILNVPNTRSDGFFAVPLNYLQLWSTQKHWIAIRKINSCYYNLDSKLVYPFCIGDEEALLQYLKNQNSIDQVEILIVVPRNVAENQSWTISKQT